MSRRRPVVLASATVIAGLLVPLTTATPAAADRMGTESTTYNAPGTYTYTVPNVLAVSVVAGGGVGQSGIPGGTGGPGAIASGTLLVTPGSTITVTIGNTGGFSPMDGGFGLSFGGNGGAGAAVSTNADDNEPGGTIIAGGGGGGGGAAGSGVQAAGPGGAGGLVGVTGGPGAVRGGGGGGGGTTTSGGAGGSTGSCPSGGNLGTVGNPGQAGVGGEGVDGPNGNGGGGGGGGFFGGGSGGSGSLCSPGGSYGGGGGGGGSSTFSTTVGSPSVCTGCNTGAAYVTITSGEVPGVFRQIDSPGTPSSTCQTEGGTPLVDTTNAGVRTFAYAYSPTVTNTDVCFRIGSSAASYGGRLTITPSVPAVSITGVGLPTVPTPTTTPPSTDTNASYCTTPPPGAAANQIPGPHPLSTGTLPGGVTWTADLYTDGLSTTWICLHAGGTNIRVIMPVAIPTITLPSIDHPTVGVWPGFDLTFYPDADNV